MRKILFSIITLLFFTMTFQSAAFADNEHYYGIGAELFQDPFNKKVIITKIIENSPISTTGITAGSEIVSVDGQKVKKITLDEVISKIRGEDKTTVKLVIRNGWRWKTYTIERGSITLPMECINTCFETYWRQISPVCHRCNRIYPKEISKKFSRKYRKTVLPVIEYWFNRRIIAEEGYNTCMTYSKENQEMCLVNFLNRENQKTIEDKKLYKLLQNDM